MSATSRVLEAGYDKLARWVAAEFRTLGRDASLEASPTLREAVQRLRGRSELLSSVHPTYLCPLSR
jgi:hypothetical protein